MSAKHGRSVLERSRSYDGFSEKKYLGPLTYSTELSRSAQLYKARRALNEDGEPLRGGLLEAEGHGDGAGPIKKVKDWYLASDLTDALVNVRTDGKRIMMAVRKERGSGFQIETFEAGAEAAAPE